MGKANKMIDTIIADVDRLLMDTHSLSIDGHAIFMAITNLVNAQIVIAIILDEIRTDLEEWYGAR